MRQNLARASTELHEDLKKPAHVPKCFHILPGSNFGKGRRRIQVKDRFTNHFNFKKTTAIFITLRELVILV